MSIFGGVIQFKPMVTILLIVFLVLALGYLLGRITVKGVSLGDAGVFIVALVIGALLFKTSEETGLNFIGSKEKTDFNDALTLIENFGLILFVTAVGFIAGPKFFGNFKRNFKSYVLLGFIIILTGGLVAAGCVGLGEVVGYGASITEQDGFVAMIVGLLSGALTSTPAFSAAKATVSAEYQSLVSVGHGIAYIFGVIGVVLFVQLIPKITKANMNEERAKLVIVETKEKKDTKARKLFEIDHMGIAAFALAAIVGCFIGSIKIPLSKEGLSGTCFSLTNTGGCLLTSLIFGHFARIGKVNISPNPNTLKLFRELGLVLFLVGAGIPGGAEFLANFDAMYFVYGILMTIIPMIVGFIFAKYVLKLSLLNNLGSLTGGMTSTPALGTLIATAETEDVASAYAATYPVALIAVVLVSQFLIILL